jgi:hypoxanthine-guanine phosphoribosyltransferase
VTSKPPDAARPHATESIKEKLFKNNMLILYLLNKMLQFIAIQKHIIICISEFDFYQVSSHKYIVFSKGHPGR